MLVKLAIAHDSESLLSSWYLTLQCYHAAIIKSIEIQTYQFSLIIITDFEHFKVDLWETVATVVVCMVEA